MKSEKQTNLLKCCKQCKRDFLIPIPDKCGSGSTGSLRRVFCGDKCKNEHNRKKSEGKVDRVCKICDLAFLSYPSQQRLYCSRPCKNIGSGRALTKDKLQISCPNCGCGFERGHRAKYPLYCSRKCQIDGSHLVKECVTCTSRFVVKKSDGHIQRCSRKCQFIDQSNGKIKIHLNGRTGFRTDLGAKEYFKSALEADYARFLNYINIPFEYETKTFITAKGAYTPDFFLPSLQLYIELKGVVGSGKPFELLMTKNLSNHKVLLEQGVQIITISQKEFISGLKAVNLWKVIPNLEQRNYRKTKGLVITHEDQANTREKSRLSHAVN